MANLLPDIERAETGRVPRGTAKATPPPTDTAQQPITGPSSVNLLAEIEAAEAQESQQQPQKGGLFTRLAESAAGGAETLGRGTLEFMAGANRAALEILDFLGPDQVNAILELSGSETRVPTLMGTEFGQKAAAGGFIEDPLARDILGQAGEFATTGAVAGQILRQVAQRSVPVLESGGETVRAGIARQLAQTTAVGDILAGGTAGAGAAAGGATGRAVAGDVGEQVGEFVGGIVAPSAVDIARRTAAATGLGRQVDTPQTQRAEEIIKAGVERDIPVLTSDVLPPKTIVGKLARNFAEKIPFLGTGRVRGRQQEARVDAIQQLDKETPPIDSEAIFESLKGSVNKVKRAAGKRINSVVEEMEPFGAVPVRNTNQAMDRAIDALTREGRIPNEPIIRNLEVLKQTLNSAPQDFKQLRQFRTDMRKLVDTVDPAGRSQLRSSDQVLMDNVERGVTKDLDRFVKANIGTDETAIREFNRYKAADKAYAQEAAKLTKSRLKNALDRGDVKPEVVSNILFSTSPSEVKLMHKNLDAAGRDHARMALLRNALDKATFKGEVNVDRLMTQMNRYRKQFEVFFRGDNRRELEGLQRVITATSRAQQFTAAPPTGQELLAPGALIAGAYGGVTNSLYALGGAGSLGLISRAYESARVRNLLIRIAKTKKGSVRERNLINSVANRLRNAAAEDTTTQLTDDISERITNQPTVQ